MGLRQSRGCRPVHRSNSGFGRFFLWGRNFPGTNDPGNGLAYGNHGAFLRLDTSEDSVARAFDLHDCFVGFDFEKGLAFGDRITFLFPPGDELAISNAGMTTLMGIDARGEEVSDTERNKRL